MTLPVKLSYPPMEAEPAEELPSGPAWRYEPKWDGFRCLAFRDGRKVELESKSQKPLTRYFPELVESLESLKASAFVLDGEIVIPVDGNLSFDDLLMRIHPAASRVKKLSRETPCVYIVFDLLVDEDGHSLVKKTLLERRSVLEKFLTKFGDAHRRLQLSPFTKDLKKARTWFHMGVGLDGIVAKRDDLPYQSGNRAGMQKIKKQISGEEAPCGLAAVRPLQRARSAGSRGIHLLDPQRGEARTHKKMRGVDRSAGFYGQSPGRLESLEHQTFDGMGADAQQACG
jgi:ATP-dependent DNA ligase